MIKKLIRFIKEFVFTFFQFVTFFSIIFFHIIYKPKVTRPKGLRVPHGTLIVANHQVWIDPWFIGYFMGFRNCLSLLPLRFPIASNIYRHWFVGDLVRVLGGFDIGTTPMEKAKGLLLIRELLNGKYTILIFPEGERNKENKKIDFKKGIEILSHENAPMLLVRLENMSNLATFKFWRSNISVTYSQMLENISPEEKDLRMQEFFHLS